MSNVEASDPRPNWLRRKAGRQEAQDQERKSCGVQKASQQAKGGKASRKACGRDVPSEATRGWPSTEEQRVAGQGARRERERRPARAAPTVQNVRGKLCRKPARANLPGSAPPDLHRDPSVEAPTDRLLRGHVTPARDALGKTVNVLKWGLPWALQTVGTESMGGECSGAGCGGRVCCQPWTGCSRGQPPGRGAEGNVQGC